MIWRLTLTVTYRRQVTLQSVEIIHETYVPSKVFGKMNIDRKVGGVDNMLSD